MHRFLLPVIAAIALTAVAAPPAGAQAPSLDDFKLRQTDLDLQSRVDALAGQLVKSDVGPLLNEANRPAVEGGPCKDDAFPGIPAGSQWFCFDESDSGDGSGQVEWIPQGVTTAADAGEPAVDKPSSSAGTTMRSSRRRACA
jgi:hypothetical protein